MLGFADSSTIPHRLLLAKTVAVDFMVRHGASSLGRQQEAQAVRMQVQKWGNSLALRISNPVTEEADVEFGDTFLDSEADGSRF